MSNFVFNAALAAGVAAASAGASLQWGAGIGLMVCGGLLIALTLATGILFARGD